MARRVFKCPIHNCTISFEACINRQYRGTFIATQRCIRNVFFPECQKCEKGIKVREAMPELAQLIRNDNRIRSRKRFNENGRTAVLRKH